MTTMTATINCSASATRQPAVQNDAMNLESWKGAVEEAFARVDFEEDWVMALDEAFNQAEAEERFARRIRKAAKKEKKQEAEVTE